MGFCCGPSDVKVLPKNNSSASTPSPSAKDSSSGGKKKQPQGVEGKEKRRCNLDRAAMATPRIPFHSRPGLM
ncbi:hypothetical protein ACQJBY_025591 [Aegilops geniculata]